jgi:hypothetical protein
MIMFILGLLIIGYVFGVALAPDDAEYDRDQRARRAKRERLARTDRERCARRERLPRA